MRISNPKYCLYCEKPAWCYGLCNMHKYRWEKRLPMEAPKNPLFKHGETVKGNERSTEYNTWKAMKRRCDNKNGQSYKFYGGRGITVCSQWVNDFGQFLIDVGRKPSPEYSLDRIDVNGNYEPSNVRWATKQQQSFNRRKFSDVYDYSKMLEERIKVLEEELKVANKAS